MAALSAFKRENQGSVSDSRLSLRERTPFRAAKGDKLRHYQNQMKIVLAATRDMLTGAKKTGIGRSAKKFGVRGL